MLKLRKLYSEKVAKLLASHSEEPELVSRCSLTVPGLGSTPSLPGLSMVIPYCLWQQAITGVPSAIMPFLNVGSALRVLGRIALAKLIFTFRRRLSPLLTAATCNIALGQPARHSWGTVKPA